MRSWWCRIGSSPSPKARSSPGRSRRPTGRVRFAAALLRFHQILQQHAGRRTFQFEIEGAIFVNRDQHADHLALEVGGGGVEALDELAGVDAVLAQSRADGRGWGGGAAGGLELELNGDFFLCHDARTGKQVYGRQRISPDSSGFTSSPWAYNGKIFLLSEDGDTFVVQAGPDYKLLGKNSLNEMSLATPAVVRGSVFIRTRSKLYRIARSS